MNLPIEVSICLKDTLCILVSEHNGKCKHKRMCSCRSCIGRRNRRSGKKAQHMAFKTMGGIEEFPGQSNEEERWSGFDFLPNVRWEIKSGGSSVPKWVVNAIQQVYNGHGDGIRPALIIKPKGTSTYWVLMKLEDLEAECRELVRAVTVSPELITDERVAAVQSKLHAMRALLDSAENHLCGRDR